MTAPAVRAARIVSRPQSPYVGLAPYDEDDAAFFFGRSQEIAIASANLRSARLTILYGPSGVGKSSLLQAGVVHGLREQSHSEVDESPFAICTVRSWLDDPIRTLQEASRAALQELAGDEPLASPRATLTDSLHAWTEQAGTLLVVLDQFEEYFQYHGEEDTDEHLTGFAAELARVVNDPNLTVNVLLSIREDAWSKLDRFEGHIPLLFANYLRVDHLDLEAAREAIEAPIAAWNRTLEPGAEPYDIEPALIGAVLSAAGGGLAPEGDIETAADRVEAPFLQLVLERLWRATVADNAHVLTLGRLEALGGARQIVERHLLDALAALSPSEQDAASDCFRFLVSSSKAKIAHPAADLAEWTHRSEPEVTTVLDKLCSGESGRILRALAPASDEASSTSYELFHDVLAEPILAWRRVYEQERNRRAARRRLMRVGGSALALIAVLTALSVWALIERGHANRLVHSLRTFSAELVSSNDSLTAQRNTLDAKLKAATGKTTTQTVAIKKLNATNVSLRRQTRNLRTSRDGLDRQIASLRVENKKLAMTIGRLNGANKKLATKINRLDGEYDQLGTRLDNLASTHDSLVGDADILRLQAASLAAQLKAAKHENGVLLSKAKALGYVPHHVTVEPVSQVPAQAGRPAERAAQFGIPGALDTHDALRRQIAQLQQQLARWLERRARLTDEAKWLKRDNNLLTRQRDALRAEIVGLDATKARLASRQRTLRQTLAAAEVEHRRLSTVAAGRESRNAKRKKAVAAQTTANTRLQKRNNQHVGAIGGKQVDLGNVRDANHELVAYIAQQVDKLLRGAQDASTDPILAGLLAVTAYQFTPYGRDDPAHPDVYNALWLVLNRFDANAARDLIAPVAKPNGKLGTTTSALIKQKLCTFVKRGFTPDEWRSWLPAGAPFTAKSSQPCP